MDIVATIYFYTILHGLMWVNFGLGWLKCDKFSITQVLMRLLWDSKSWFHPYMRVIHVIFLLLVQRSLYPNFILWLKIYVDDFINCHVVSWKNFPSNELKVNFFLYYFGCYMSFGDKICFDVVAWLYLLSWDFFVYS